MDPNLIPVSTPAFPGTSFLNLPTELRLEIFTLMLSALNMPRSYGYTGGDFSPPTPPPDPRNPLVLSPQPPPPAPPPAPKTFTQHAMILVSKQVSAEYRQCFYERTTFFLHIDRQNAFRAVPDLERDPDFSLPAAAAPGGLPAFWPLPPALIASVRHCTLFIELGAIASSHRAAHSISRAAKTDLSSRRRSSALRCSNRDDAEFDSALMSAVLMVLNRMHQLQSVQLVWDLSVMPQPGERSRKAAQRTRNSANWKWESLGEMYVRCLMKKPVLKEARVKVGDRFVEDVWSGKRVNGVWEGKLVRSD